MSQTRCCMRKVVVYDGSGITSSINKSKPQIGDPCHTLHTDSRNYLVEVIEEYSEQEELRDEQT